MAKPIMNLVKIEGYRKLSKTRARIKLGYSPILVHDLVVAMAF